MQLGISTSCLFPMLTEEALAHTLALGAKTVEVFLNSPSERTHDFARQLREQAETAGARIVSVHPYSSEYEGVGFFSRYPRRFSDAMEDYRQYFAFCAEIGAPYLVFHGIRNIFPIPNELYFERFAALREAGKREGVRVCQENVAPFHSGDPHFIERLRAAIPDADFVLDIKQCRRAGVDPLRMLAAMGQNLCHIHASDHSDTHDCLPIGEGSFDWLRFLTAAAAAGFDGSVVVELYRWNFESETALSESLDRLLALEKAVTEGKKQTIFSTLPRFTT